MNQFWCLLLYCRICSVCFSGLQRMRTRINLQSTWKSQIILVMNYMNDTCTNSSLVAKVFSLLSTGVYQHSKLIVPKKKEKLCIKDEKKNVKYLKFAKRHQMTSKRYMTCVLIKGNIVYIFFSPSAFSEYKACVAPACTDVTMDKSIGTIDPFSLSVQNEYIFIKVH